MTVLRHLSVPALLLAFAAAGLEAATEALPELRTVVPQHLQVQNTQQREFLRFSNGIANIGAGPLELVPEFPLPGTIGLQKAHQMIYNTDGTLSRKLFVSEFEFHADHNHWHIDNVALFEIRVGAVDGPVLNGQQIKTTFCLVDWYRLDGQSKTPLRNYFECGRVAKTQGISPGWVDQYHQATPGQELEITGAAPGIYFLVSTANPDKRFVEVSQTNNTAWVKFAIKRESKGNAKIEILGHSPAETPALAGVGAPNR